jgi:four helix bundle protein
MEGDMKSHEELEVWRKAVDLSVEVYRITSIFPIEEKSGLTYQLRRAAIAIASKIAEGSAHQNTKDFASCLSSAAGAVGELSTQLVISRQLGFSSEKALRNIEAETRILCRMLQSLMRTVE